jgi:hypothetical protein
LVVPRRAILQCEADGAIALRTPLHHALRLHCAVLARASQCDAQDEVCFDIEGADVVRSTPRLQVTRWGLGECKDCLPRGAAARNADAELHAQVDWSRTCTALLDR